MYFHLLCRKRHNPRYIRARQTVHIEQSSRTVQIIREKQTKPNHATLKREREREVGRRGRFFFGVLWIVDLTHTHEHTHTQRSLVRLPVAPRKD